MSGLTLGTRSSALALAQTHLVRAALAATHPDLPTEIREFKTTGGEHTLCTLLRRLHRTADVYVGSAGDAAVDTFKPICPEVAITVTDALVVTMNNARANGSRWCSPSPRAHSRSCRTACSSCKGSGPGTRGRESPARSAASASRAS